MRTQETKRDLRRKALFRTRPRNISSPRPASILLCCLLRNFPKFYDFWTNKIGAGDGVKMLRSLKSENKARLECCNKAVCARLLLDPPVLAPLASSGGPKASVLELHAVRLAKV